jgi:hypothetical protein
VIYSFVDSGINEQVVIDSTDAPNYQAWQSNIYGPGKTDVQVGYNIKYFDLQNPEEVLKGAKPILSETGPYAFTEYFQKFDIEWTDDGDTVTYNTQRYYIFDPVNSGYGLTEDDNITLPYPAVIGFEYLLNEIPPEINEADTEALLGALKLAEIHAFNQISQLYNDVPRGPGPIGFDPVRVDNRIISTNESIAIFFDDLYAYFNTTGAAQVLFKTLMCKTPSGVSPFWKQKPGPAWFGWLKDPLLLLVGEILATVGAATNSTIPWTSAVPGAANNYTSIADARRRRSPDTMKTGKKNKNQVSQYVKYNNMTMIRTCINSMASQNTSAYIEGEEFPACAHYQTDWNQSQWEAAGYTTPYATDYANRVAGSDANLFGRPFITNLVQVFISDIYRSVYMESTKTVGWYGIPLRRIGIQQKDVLNASVNHENQQYYMNGPYGLLNATKADNLPVFISFPHFYDADPRLVGAVEGLDPNEDEHACYLDIEPQTGLLVTAKKRLQVNYLLTDYSIPEVSQATINLGYSICANITDTINTLNKLPGINIAPLNCSNIVTEEAQCLARDSTWTFRNGGVYIPYGWAAEVLDLPASDATELKNTLFIFDDIANAVRFWSLVVGGICFAMLASMLVYNYHIDRAKRLGRYYDWTKEANSQHGPLDFGGVGGGGGGGDVMREGAQPLLSSEPSAPEFVLAESYSIKA